MRVRGPPSRSSGPARGALQSRRITPDLDIIVLKALARERARRYPSVAAFAADLVAYLERRPIAARADTVRYRLSKFVRRHRLAVATGVVVFAALVLALSVSIRQTRRANAAAEAARLEARRAERVKGFLVSVFEQADPNQSRGAWRNSKPCFRSVSPPMTRHSHQPILR